MRIRFNKERSDAATRFFRRRLHHTKGRWKGVRFDLPEWQASDILEPLFGWERYDVELEEWLRLYRRAWIEIPKKNGKSELGGGLALQGLFADGEQSPEVYSIAEGKRQAGIVFGIGANMVLMEPALARRSEVLKSKLAHHGVIYTPPTDGVYRVIPGDAAGDDGINPSRVIVDEVHRIRNREMLDLLEDSLAARKEPLIVYLTTAGVDDPSSAAWELHDHALKVQRGEVVDPYFFSYVLGASIKETDGDGWKSEDLWRRVNPAIDSFNPSMLADLRASALAAEISPAKITSFKRLRLNVWLPRAATSRNRLVDPLAWDRGAGVVDKPGLEGRDAYAALDMASSEDIAALVAAFPNVGGCRNAFCDAELCFDVAGRYFLPASVLEGDAETWTKALLPTVAAWQSAGVLEVLDGEVIDDRDIKAAVNAWRDKYELRELAVDPYQTKQIRIELEEEGLVVVEHRQTMERMAEPTDRLIRHIRARRVHHGGDPVLRWMIGNTIVRVDGNGNKRPDRKQSSGKIDGIVALIMAIASAERNLELGDDVFGFAIGGSAG